MRIAADNGVTGGGQLILTGKTDPNKQIIFGYNTTGGYGQFQAVHQGVATKHIALNPASGNVSINQATNTYALDVFSNAGPGLGGMIRIKDSDPTSFAGFKMDNSNGHGGNFFKVGPSYSGYKTIGANDFGIYNGNNSGNMTFINDYASGNITFTAGGASTAHMTITATGNVSINQATNTYALDVFTNAGPGLGGMIRIKDSDPTSFAGFKMDNSNGHGGNFFKVGPSYSGYKTIGANDFGIYNGNNSGNMTFINDYASGNITFTAGGASTAHMTITATGNVGIGGSATSTSRVNIQGLPTSSAGLSSGDLWNDTGTIKIV